MRGMVFSVGAILAASCAPPSPPVTEADSPAPTPAAPQAGEGTAPRAVRGEPGDKTVLVELFTSQGCDSCPAADAFIGELPALGWTPDELVPLTFHVTYWDDLGWQDPYGSPMFDQRQIGYATTVPGARADDETTIKGPYTPQLVVDGRVHFSGTLRDVAQEQFTRASQGKASIELTTAITTAESAGARQVTVDVTSKAAQGAELDTDRSKVGLFAALTQRELQTEVPRGENAGKKLREFWVVRELAGPKLFRSARPVNETRFSLTVPTDARAQDLDVVVFAQDLADLGIEAVTTAHVVE